MKTYSKTYEWKKIVKTNENYEKQTNQLLILKE
mgnify:CR=1 FL=1